MNYEKQDIFYSQARNVLNYSVKRLWFKINPFLETKSKNEHDLPNKFIQPQQSTVLCEKLSFSGHIDRREQGVPVGKSFKSQYSNQQILIFINSQSFSLTVLLGCFLFVFFFVAWGFVLIKELYLRNVYIFRLILFHH